MGRFENAKAIYRFFEEPHQIAKLAIMIGINCTISSKFTVNGNVYRAQVYNLFPDQPMIKIHVSKYNGSKHA